MNRRQILVNVELLFIVPLSLALGFCLATKTVAQNPLTPQEKRGRQIYVQGTSPSGKDIVAYLGDASLEVPGSTMSCNSCHGFGGRGRPEGGIDPSTVTWEALTKPSSATLVNGRRHSPYSTNALASAITQGLDPGGNKLLKAMPRYRISKEDLDDLIVYMKRLGTDNPGVSDTKILIGTALPASGQLSEMGQAVRSVMAAVFAEVNDRGGVYNRQLELKSTETGDTASATSANIERLIKGENIFAMTGTFIAGAEREVVALLAEQEVPLLGPLTLDPKPGNPINRQVFYLLSGNGEQARALVHFVATKPDTKGPIAVVYSPGALNSSVLDAIKLQSQKDALNAPKVYDYPAGSFDAARMIEQMRQTNPSSVFLVGSTNDIPAFLKEADRVGWFPQILLQAGAASAQIFESPSGFEGKVFFTVPTSPSDQTAEALKEFRVVAEKYKLPAKHLAAQISAYSATKILVEALKRAGRDLSREGLIQSLETFSEYRTGLTPDITYGSNRRIGALGAYVVMIDLKEKKFVPVGGWISIN